MPYFKWKGIDWFGRIYKGYQFSKSKTDLEKILLNQEIGLISAQVVQPKFLIRSIPLADKVRFFKELSILVDSGILIHSALEIIVKQIKSSRFKKIIQEIQFDVMGGESFANSIEKHQDVFDPLIIQLIIAGQESDKLGESLLALSNYLEEHEEFTKKLKNILFLPGITFLFFLVIAFIIFTAIIPAFFNIFSNFGQQIPGITKKLFEISFFIKSKKFCVLLITTLFVILIIIRLGRKKPFKIHLQHFFVKIPFIGQIIKCSNLTFFLQSASLLLYGGVHLVKALELSSNSVKNLYLKGNFRELYYQVDRGTHLSLAMFENQSKLFLPDLIAMIRVGEESGNLNLMLEKSFEFILFKNESVIIFFPWGYSAYFDDNSRCFNSTINFCSIFTNF